MNEYVNIRGGSYVDYSSGELHDTARNNHIGIFRPSYTGLRIALRQEVLKPFRGGAYNDRDAMYFRSSERQANWQTLLFNNVGFRVARRKR